jgi:hypothetical protein
VTSAAFYANDCHSWPTVLVYRLASIGRPNSQTQPIAPEPGTATPPISCDGIPLCYLPGPLFYILYPGASKKQFERPLQLLGGLAVTRWIQSPGRLEQRTNRVLRLGMEGGFQLAPAVDKRYPRSRRKEPQKRSFYRRPWG